MIRLARVALRTARSRGGIHRRRRDPAVLCAARVPYTLRSSPRPPPSAVSAGSAGRACVLLEGRRSVANLPGGGCLNRFRSLEEPIHTSTKKANPVRAGDAKPRDLLRRLAGPPKETPLQNLRE